MRDNHTYNDDIKYHSLKWIESAVPGQIRNVHNIGDCHCNQYHCPCDDLISIQWVSKSVFTDELIHVLFVSCFSYSLLFSPDTWLDGG